MKICWQTNISTNDLNGYFRTVNVGFPFAFNSTPVVITGNYGSLGNTAAETNMSTRAQDVTTTGCTIKLGTKDGQISSINCKVSYIAIGF